MIDEQPVEPPDLKATAAKAIKALDPAARAGKRAGLAERYAAEYARQLRDRETGEAS